MTKTERTITLFNRSSELRASVLDETEQGCDLRRFEVSWPFESLLDRPVMTLIVHGDVAIDGLLDRLLTEVDEIEFVATSARTIEAVVQRTALLRAVTLELCDISDLDLRRVSYGHHSGGPHSVTLKRCTGTSKTENYHPTTISVEVPCPEPLSANLLSQCTQCFVQGHEGIKQGRQGEGFIRHTRLASAFVSALATSTPEYGVHFSNVSISPQMLAKIGSLRTYEVTLHECGIRPGSVPKGEPRPNSTLQSVGIYLPEVASARLNPMLASLVELKELSIDVSSIDRPFLSAIASLPQLRYLAIHRIRRVDDAADLPVCNQVTTLYVTGPRAEDFDWQRIFPNAEM